MKREWRDRWTAAMRGGHYKRGVTRLRWFNNTCCPLGVLCDLVDPGGWKQSEYYDSWQHGGTFGGCAFPSEALLKEVGLSTQDAWRVVDNNDCKDMDFNANSDWIERNL